MSANSQPQVISYGLKTGRWSHTFAHEWLWSIKRNKWVKGVCHKGLWWGCDYLILPGRYAVVKATGFHDDRGVTLSIQVVDVRIENEKMVENIVEEVKTELPSYDAFISIQNDPDAPEALKDFVKGAPACYHCVSANPPSDKTYQPGELERMKQYVKTVITKFAED